MLGHELGAVWLEAIQARPASKVADRRHFQERLAHCLADPSWMITMVVIEKSVVETRDGYAQLLGSSPERSTDHLANLSVADALAH